MKTINNLIFIAAAFPLLVLFSPGCATVVKEIQPPSGTLSFKTIAVQVSAKEDVNKQLAERFAAAFVKKMKDAKLYDNVVTGPGQPKDLTLKLDITRIEEGSANLRFVNMGGEGEIYLDGSLIQNKKTIGTFSVKGTSQSKSQKTVNGVPVTKINEISQDRMALAFESASKGLVDYLKSKKH
ncbi:MAG: hypothetical protein A2078_01505 [Nitrospirae bacterium GWC2_57_9]|nr:MAG: hypothetical protein A2078_01505 [Nitrospirae bacterium GWC2_57_9]